MTLAQGEAFGILAVMLILFASDKLRYDLIGGLALIAAALTGIVPANHVFSGFANPVIIIIASVLVLSRAIAISGVVEGAIRRILGATKSPSIQIGVLTASVAGLSAFMKNVGTLGIFMPIAIQTAERSKRPPSLYLMPLAFGSLVGGTMTLIGTGPNLLISTVRQEIEGKTFKLFDFLPVGAPLTVVAIVFLALGWRLIPKTRRRAQPGDYKEALSAYSSEAAIPTTSPLIGKTIQDFEEATNGEVTITSVIRRNGRRYIPNSQSHFIAGEILVLQVDPVALPPILEEYGLELHSTGEALAGNRQDAVESVEAVVTANSPIIGESPRSLHIRRRFEASLLGISRAGHPITERIAHTRFQAGDVIVMQGPRDSLPATLSQLGCLAMDPALRIGRRRLIYVPLLILLGVMITVSLGWVSADVAFFGAAVLVVLLGLISPKEAYESIDWPVIIMLGSLIPVGEALKLTGASGLIGNALTTMAMHLPGPFALGLVLIVSMLVTPFLHHAAAVLVMGPVAATLAHNLGYQTDPFLMAVALGASSDFLSPIGHQNNALVMGPGGYRFTDYWRLGLPLSIIVAVLGTILIISAWPLK
ncbi:MAG TPA: SLC13 family permease [Alphaproteobacteria bacterium]|nr:SLC13 family permease [Alphaproteobacteria bacterium]